MMEAAKVFKDINPQGNGWVCLPIAGTTTSGDPAGTTLVNTVHSLMFDWLY